MNYGGFSWTTILGQAMIVIGAVMAPISACLSHRFFQQRRSQPRHEGCGRNALPAGIHDVS
ncbi:MAG: hypothetical protein IJZ74_07915 [Clostridia bacterium]|nr:hypothetical protein [Clostridia bacterium]